MSTWTGTKLGACADQGALHLALFSDREVGPYMVYALYLYPREGITIGGKTRTDRIGVLSLRAKTEFLARLEAEHVAEKWFQKNVVALCSGEPIT